MGSLDITENMAVLNATGNLTDQFKIALKRSNVTHALLIFKKKWPQKLNYFQVRICDIEFELKNKEGMYDYEYAN